MNSLLNIFDISYHENLGLSGLTDESFCLLVESWFLKENKDILIVTPTLTEANQLFNILSSLEEDVLFFPMDDFLTSEAISISPELLITRLETLKELNNHSKKIIITHLMGYLRYLPPKRIYNENICKITLNDKIDPKVLEEKLYFLGYNKESLVTKTGDFCARGFIVDIFPISSSNPIRIEFFGEEIESIRLFDPDTQKSIQKIDEFIVYPNTEFLLDKYPLEELKRNQKYLPDYLDKVVNIEDYLHNPIVIIKDYSLLINTYDKIQKDITNYQEKDSFKHKYMFPLSIINFQKVVYYLNIDNILPNHNFYKFLDFKVKLVPKFHENIEYINSYLSEELNQRKQIIICLKKYQIKNFTKYLKVKYLLTDIDNLSPDLVNIVDYSLEEGFIYNDIIVLTDKDLFNITLKKKRYKTNFKYSVKINSINNLEIGDYVVHSIHGIGIYNGLRTLKVGDLQKDFLEITYKGDDKLYIPVEKIDYISKFCGKEGISPKINSLNGLEWKRNKQRIISKVRDIADKLIKLYALRSMQKGFAFSKDDSYHQEFFQQFAYQPTGDQLKAYEEIRIDMEKESPMDRLLCGDVGFGKTEVAFRAMFKAVYDNKQVLYLCPTTILSNQQYLNAIERFKDFPIKIELINRFTTPKKQKEIVEELKNGTVDIVIGTHRLLSDDIKPKALGLLVIDEEQRFGVVHKEKIKQYKENVDVLTLTATPIPRTLQMSIVGLRSLSLIKTPPVDRYPVQTYVVYEQKDIIKDAIVKELLRDGQVFILYNRIDSIDSKMEEIQKLVPNARIIVAHGQLSKNELEDRMIKFINHEYDILICTTIIETGIDIPNVNTLIVLDAFNFGLAQLYQIRGRVGRSNKIAYAYLMYPEHKILTEQSVKRLNVLKEFTELGSGYAIANRDLVIRGAGDILGAEQAGFIDTVGIDLYLKILNEEVKKLKGEKIPEEVAKDKPMLNVSTHIDSKYVFEEDMKIEIHKMINSIDSYEKLLAVKEEFEDRFGKVNEDILIYMYEEWFEKLALEKGVLEIKQTPKEIKLIFSIEASQSMNRQEMFLKAYNISRNFNFTYAGSQICITLILKDLIKHPVYYLIDLLK